MELAPFFPYIHQILKPAFPSCLWTGQGGEKTIALTFDDGPHPKHTPPLLELLDRYQVPASFFWLGQCVDYSPAVARLVYEAGHWVGLHGYTHRSFPRLTVPQLKDSLERTQMAIAQACDLPGDYVQQSVRDVRPPNGFFTPNNLVQLQQWGYRPVMWSVVPEDWVRPGIDVVVERVLSQTRDGSLIVLHDGYCGGEDVVAIAQRLIPLLLDQGYQFVTVEELWRLHPTQHSAPVQVS
ncbi:polysaccharide deacetylase family protein [Leptolyngbya sp. AN02str]|uniref:polysaccharide deacetylase family protein n=1 Tax=Leptolyngbya sp. AN02str TaxID=3423363 RepID=UPI003D3204E9